MLPGFSWGSFVNAFPGHILDENHGLFLYSPFYLLVFPGAVFMWRERRDEAVWLILFVMSFYIGIASFREWWGGFCPPGRYLVPILGLCVPFVGYAICRFKRVRWLHYALGCSSIAIGCFSMWFSGRLYRHLHSFIPYISWINLRGLFPNMVSPDGNDYKLLLGWLLAAVVCAVWIVANSGRESKFALSGNSSKFFLVLLCAAITIALLRKESAVSRSDYDRLMLYGKLLKREHSVFSIGRTKPIYSVVKDRERIFGPFCLTYEAEHLLHDRKNMVKDERDGNKVVVRGRADEKGFLLWGPYKRFPAGRYRARIVMRTENIEDKTCPVAVFDVVSSKGAATHARKEIYNRDFQASGGYAEIVTQIEIKRKVSDVEFRIYHSGNADVYVDRIDIIALSLY